MNQARVTALSLTLLLGAALDAFAGRPTVVTARCPPDAVLVGPLCVDMYEASVWEIDPADGLLIKQVQRGRISDATELTDAGAKPRGADSADYGDQCPRSGQGCTTLYAVSIPGVLPAQDASWFQAQEACTNAGKRLLTNAEWQAAAMGTPDPGTDNGTTDCSTDSPNLSKTGKRTDCVSVRGAFDMVGNLNEWVADWTTYTGMCTDWTTEAGFPGNDGTCWGQPPAGAALPAPILRGGSRADRVGAGVFATFSGSPLREGIGFRCAR